jgi:alkane 1-monooxygenase
MTTYSMTRADGTSVSYVDRKRQLWIASLAMPLIPLAGIALYLATGSQLWFLTPLVFFYVLIPLADIIVGNDQNNPPEELVPQLEQDNYYRYLIWATIPAYFVTLVTAGWVVGTQSLSTWAIAAVALAVGQFSGTAITLGHELGHKKSLIDRLLARIVLAVPAYGHFPIEHNRGHHTQVATPEDPASSRMGETIYRFACREMPGALARGWRLEKERLERAGKPTFCVDNEVLQSWGLTFVINAGLVVAFGWIVVPFLVLHHLAAWWGLTSANYIEHYGLKRQKLGNGRYERCEPRHSWNSNHVVSNILSFHLERHSDHHANPTRSYQSLRHFEDAPALPGGYSTMFLMAYVPPVWFRAMDPRVVAWANGDLDKVNVQPGKRAALEMRYAAQLATV